MHLKQFIALVTRVQQRPHVFSLGTSEIYNAIVSPAGNDAIVSTLIILDVIKLYYV